MTENEKTTEKDKSYLKRLNKWHNRQIDYLSFNINLLLTISVATLAYLLNLKENGFFKSETKIVLNNFEIYSILIGLIITLGIIVNVIRYFDFKFTKDILKIRRKILKKEGNIVELNKKLNRKICLANTLGFLTQFLFISMVILFIFALWSILIEI